ncbi:MAG: IPT/TIG domain-containing protein [Ignavibacteriales bacterium]|nr:IPT/TIG domain-containing protein [Ignavibacteriales bacterium]
MKLLSSSLLAPIAVLSLMLIGCENEKTGSLYDPNYASPRPDPTITSVAPSGGALAAVDTLAITGTNFSATLSENTVYFNGTPASLLSASTTQLRLLSPLTPGSGIEIKTGVTGASLFSNTVKYDLTAAVVAFGNLGPTETAGPMTRDASGNLTVSIKPEGVNARIFKFTTAGVRSEYAPETGGTPQWTSLRFGPGGFLYTARGIRAVYRFPAGGGSAAALWVAFPVGVFATDIEFDQNQNLWVGGNNSNLYLIRPNATTKAFPFVGNVRSVRVYGGHLYFAATTASGDQIWRAAISGEDLGTPEVYFDFGAAFAGQGLIPTSMTFSSDGYLYIGTNAPAYLVLVAPSKSYASPYRAYSTSFGTGILALMGGNGNALYVSTTSGALLKVLWGKTTAPYYGQ